MGVGGSRRGLSPVLTDRAEAPDSVLRVVSCGCKVQCSTRCRCRKAGLHCTVMCSSCIGQTCSNIDIEQVDDEQVDDDWSELEFLDLTSVFRSGC